MGIPSSSILIAILMAASAAPPVGARTIAAPADDDYVRRVAGRAAALVEEGRYGEALDLLDRAHRERPHAVFVYVQATIEEQRGDCERAVALYREYLAMDVADADAEDARRGEARCRQVLQPRVSEPEPEPASASAPEPAPAPDETAPSEPPESAGSGDTSGPNDGRPVTSPWWPADVAGGVLAGTGLVGLGTGIGLFARGRIDARALGDSSSLQLYEDRAQRSLRLNQAGIVTMALGSALLVAGVVRYAVVARRARRGPTDSRVVRIRGHRGGLSLRF